VLITEATRLLLERPGDLALQEARHPAPEG
jgi:hypothetical protein